MPPVPPIQDFYGFLAIVTWDKENDEEASARLLRLFDELPDGIHRESFQGYYLTGERKLIFIGKTANAESLQVLSSKIIYKVPIEAKFYHTIEIHKMKTIYENWQNV